MNKKSVRRISNYLILPKFQLPLILFNLVIMLGLFCVVFYELKQALESMRQLGVTAGLPPSHPYFQFINHSSNDFLVRLGMALGAGFFITLFANLVLSHKLAGPIYRLYLYFAVLKQGGRREPIHFRKGDYLQDLGELINETIVQRPDSKLD